MPHTAISLKKTDCFNTTVTPRFQPNIDRRPDSLFSRAGRAYSAVQALRLDLKSTHIKSLKWKSKGKDKESTE